MIPTEKIQHPRLKFVDHSESFGRHVLRDWITDVPVQRALDIGCGLGMDLQIVKDAHPNAKLFGVDFSDWNQASLGSRAIELVVCNVESSSLPFDNESLDLVIANQVFEHTKEIFWINHEIFRTLKVGGHLYLGVPNTLAFHNRVLAMLGRQPTCIQSISAHVRSFSKHDVLKYYNRIGSSFLTVAQFRGAQFYPFPPSIARPLANTMPSLAVGIFFLIKKTAQYNSEFLDWVEQHELETNFFVGG